VAFWRHQEADVVAADIEAGAAFGVADHGSGDALPKATKILEDRLHLNPSPPACSCQTHNNSNKI
jgi:hypothetical protein